MHKTLSVIKDLRKHQALTLLYHLKMTEKSQLEDQPHDLDLDPNLLTAAAATQKEIN